MSGKTDYKKMVRKFKKKIKIVWKIKENNLTKLWEEFTKKKKWKFNKKWREIFKFQEKMKNGDKTATICKAIGKISS